MKVTEVTVSAGRTFNHPYEDYSNLKPYVSIKATLEDGEVPEEVIKQLQAKAESLVEDHKQHMLESLRTLYLMGQHERQVAGLESSIKQAQEDLEELRQKQQVLFGGALPEPDERGRELF